MFEIDKLPQSIDIGFTGEHAFRTIQIDMTAWMESMPNGIPIIVHIRPGQSEADAYVATTTFANNILTWEIAMSDLGNEEGTGIAQVWLEDATGLTVNHRGKSAVFTTVVHESAGEATVVPSGQLDWDEQLDKKVSKSDVANNLTTIVDGKVMDARQGKVLDEKKVDKTDVENSLLATDSGKVLDARQGKVLDEKKVDAHTNQPAGKFLQTNSSGDATWGEPVSSTQVANSVNAWLNTNVPTGTTVVVDKSLSVGDAAADSETVGVAIDYDERLINDGEYTIKASELESGQWSYSTKSENTACAMCKNLIRVKKGTTILYSNTTFDTYFNVLETPSSGSYLSNIGWKTDGDGIVSIDYDGYLVFNIRNHADTSATVDPTEYNSTVTIKTKVQSDIESTIVQTENLATVGDRYVFPFERKVVATANPSYTFSPSTTRMSTNPITFDNKFLEINVDTGYYCVVYFSNGSGTRTYRVMTAGKHFMYAQKDTPVVFVLRNSTDNTVIELSESSHVSISEVKQETTDVGCGIVNHNLSYDIGGTIAATTPYYTNTSYRYASCPIKIPKSGLRIGYNGKYHTQNFIVPTNVSEDGTIIAATWNIPSFRIVAMKKTNSGLVVETDDEDIEAASKTSGIIDSVYIPYIEDCYIIIVLHTDNALSNVDYSDLLYVSSGSVERSYCGVYNIGPTSLLINPALDGFDGMNSLVIHGRISDDYSYSSLLHYFTIVRLRDAKKIVCSPKYTLLANIYKINEDNTIERYADEYGIWGSSSPSGQTSSSGLPVIDFEKYDFDGFAVVAIQSTVIYKKTGAASVQLRKLTTGNLGGYEDVRNSVCVDYKNGVNVAYVPGMPSILEENIHKLCNWRVPEYPSGYYTESAETGAHYFPTQYNAVPSMYAGTYLANSYLMNVTAKSIMTCLKNPNGRARKMQRVQAGQPGTDGVPTVGNIGYGLTCTNFTSVIHGLMENYTPWSMSHQENKLKFDTYPFDYRDLSTLRPGDVLSMHYEEPMMGRYNKGHLMTVSSIVTVNGTIKAVNIIEGGIPYDRFTTCVAEEYYLPKDPTESPGWLPINDTINRLADYKWRSRIKPEYLKPITETFDMYPENTEVGKIMCDRGTDSAYSVNNEFIEISWKAEDVDEYIYLYKDNSLVETMPITSANLVNGYMMMNIADYIHEHGRGDYKLVSDKTTGTYDERFCVFGNVSPTIRVNNNDNTTTLTIPEAVSLSWVEVWNSLPTQQGETEEQREHRLATRSTRTYVLEEFEIDAKEDAATITIPRYTVNGSGETMDIISIDHIHVGGIFGTWWSNMAGTVRTGHYSEDA